MQCSSYRGVVYRQFESFGFQVFRGVLRVRAGAGDKDAEIAVILTRRYRRKNFHTCRRVSYMIHPSKSLFDTLIIIKRINNLYIDRKRKVQTTS